MERDWLFNGISAIETADQLNPVSRKVGNSSRSSDDQVRDFVSKEWPRLPAGVKFDPSDLELIEHLAAKCGVGTSKPHVFIEEFISTLDEEKGICYTHPETLPGAKKDGSCIYFFHKICNAYATGPRKRRKIQSHSISQEGPVRWHKTGKTKPVLDSSGVHRGYKKIMVLYKSSNKGSKPDKSKWVVHQYHLGADEDEKGSEYVVSKVFYHQQRQDDPNGDFQMANEFNVLPLQTCPLTPNPNPPNRRRLGQSGLLDDLIDDNILQPPILVGQVTEADNQTFAAIGTPEDDMEYSAYLASESPADLDIEMFNPYSLPYALGQNNVSGTVTTANSDQVTEVNGAPCGIYDVENFDFDTPPGFPDFQFGPQDSILDWFSAH